MKSELDVVSGSSIRVALEDYIPKGAVWSFQPTDFLVAASTIDYVQPTYHVIQESVLTHSPYLVVSAAGAVGKSAFGLHLASKKNAMLWDLSKLRLGSNTFVGSILQAVGTDALASFLKSIEAGKTTLIFDAVDEAELHSGWSGVNEFLKDVVKLTANAAPSSVIFLARRDSAEMVQMALEEILPPGQSVAAAGIGFFAQEQAAEFVLAQVKNHRDAGYIGKNETALRAKINEAFSIPVADDEASESAGQWRSAEQERFFGYAPVLQTIAKLLAASDNAYSVTFKDKKTGYSEVISGILQQILDRESTKFSQAVTLRLSDDLIEIDAIYSSSEQQKRILGFLCGDDSEAYAYPASSKPAIDAQIREMLRSFLPQHPFLDGRNFAGPAFRDYVLANGLVSDDRRLLSELWIESAQPLFTPILASLYHSASSGVAKAEDAEMLYESANAGAVCGHGSLKLFTSDNDASKVTIEITSDGSSPLADGLVFIAENSRELTFSRRLSNADIITNGTVVFGRIGLPFDLIDSEVFAEQVQFRSDRVRVRSESIRATRIESVSPIQAPPTIKIDLHAGGLSIIAPNSKAHPWTHFSSDIALQQNVDVDTTLHVVARILGWFRKDKRKEFGRYKDLIVKHIVGSSVNARYALGFIQHIGALSEGGNLYFIDTQALDSYEISWQKIRSGTVSEKARGAVKKYLTNTPEPPVF